MPFLFFYYLQKKRFIAFFVFRNFFLIFGKGADNCKENGVGLHIIQLEIASVDWGCD
jgi:hypothetical protein